MRKRDLLLLSIALLCSGCGQAEQTASRPAMPPTITPMPTPTLAAASPTSTPLLGDQASGALIRDGKQALAEQNYEQAIAIFTQLRIKSPENQDIALLLGEAYAAWGDSLVSNSNGEPEKIRQAFDLYSAALRYLPATDEAASHVGDLRDVMQRYLHVHGALGAVDTIADLSERQTRMGELLDASEFIQATLPSLPGFKPLYQRVLLAAAQLQRAAAEQVSGRDNRLPLWRKGLEYCEAAAALWDKAAEDAKAARACVSEISALISPPTPTAKPTPSSPTKPNAAPKPAPRGFYGQIVRNYPSVQGSPSGQSASCVTGRVIQRNGAGVAGAVGNVNNGQASIKWVTNGAGEFSACGLGYSNWAAVLFYTPTGFNGALTVPGVWVNGAADQVGIVEFRER